jgi:pyruvate/2-oxoglutarate/acetoin dehydrogenase E1 component
MLPRCLEVAKRVRQAGRRIEVIDLRTLVPLDTETVKASVGRTGRAVVVHEDTFTSGFGAEVAARLADECFYELDAPILRVSAPDLPAPAAVQLEERYLPSRERIEEAVWRTLKA